MEWDKQISLPSALCAREELDQAKERSRCAKLLLFRQVKNAKDIRSQLINGSFLPNVCFLNAKLIVHPLQVFVACNSAISKERRSQMTTRSITAEIVYQLSSSKNITESLKSFGLNDNDQDYLAVLLDDTEGENEKRLLDAVDGIKVHLEKLREITDWQMIRKLHKLQDVIEEELLESALISKAASKSISS